SKKLAEQVISDEEADNVNEEPEDEAADTDEEIHSQISTPPNSPNAPVIDHT
ncbi:hypothetical protein A2U01_0066359, partial [Trifolium medium]|nr:hypothetical protein [Trifolium medium]